jgi:glycerol-3-phosphate dehydrogenase
MNTNYDIVIIGAGVVGCATARELSKYRFKVLLVEKETDAAEGISKANSGVIHAGFNVKPGSLKAKLNNEGIFMLPQLADELGVEYRICKKLVVAKNDLEKTYLEKLYLQGQKNNTPGLSIIDSQTIKSLEPKVIGKWALYSENTGIITPYQLTISLAENAMKNGVNINLNTKISNIIKNRDGSYIIYSDKLPICKTRWIINSAGMFSDTVAGLLEASPEKIYPCRGEYYILDKNSRNALDMAIYPVPPSDGSGLGVHLTPAINGNILIGPSADYINEKYNVANTKEVMNILKKEAFELIPLLKNYDFIKNFSGIRPKLFNSNSGKNFADFHISESENNPNFINLIGIESPGLTSAPAIAKYILEYFISKKEKTVKKNSFNSSWTGIRRTANMDISELQSLYKTDRDYGELICRCEQVTRKEIIQALNNPLNVKTLNGIKKRTHSMMGRCQGGFCISRISRILIEEYGLQPEQVVKNSPESNMYF